MRAIFQERRDYRDRLSPRIRKCGFLISRRDKKEFLASSPERGDGWCSPASSPERSGGFLVS